MPNLSSSRSHRVRVVPHADINKWVAACASITLDEQRHIACAKDDAPLKEAVNPDRPQEYAATCHTVEIRQKTPLEAVAKTSVCEVFHARPSTSTDSIFARATASQEPTR
jgi:hypothetical protein